MSTLLFPLSKVFLLFLKGLCRHVDFYNASNVSFQGTYFVGTRKHMSP